LKRAYVLRDENGISETMRLVSSQAAGQSIVLKRGFTFFRDISKKYQKVIKKAKARTLSP